MQVVVGKSREGVGDNTVSGGSLSSEAAGSDGPPGTVVSGDEIERPWGVRIRTGFLLRLVLEI